MLNRNVWVTAVVLAACAMGVWQLARRGEAPAAVAQTKLEKRIVANGPALRAMLQAEPPVADPLASEPATSANVARWIADAQGGDAGKRATAIAALARAPRQQALPVLHRVLTDGEPVIDRPLALRSLRELALEQGDDDGAIRSAIREVIYHGDDQTVLADVQDTLDVIEESEMR